MPATPVHFTIAFRQKMATLAQSERRLWLASLAARLRQGQPPAGDIFWQELREVARGCRLSLSESIRAEHGDDVDPLMRWHCSKYRASDSSVRRTSSAAATTLLCLSMTRVTPRSAPPTRTRSCTAFLLSARATPSSSLGRALGMDRPSPHSSPDAQFERSRSTRISAHGRRLRCRGYTLSLWSAPTQSRTAARGAPPQGVRDVRSRQDSAALAGCPSRGRAPGGPRRERPPHAANDAFERIGGRIVRSDHGAVRYVRNRSVR